MDCSTPGLPVHHQLPEFTQTHVHRVSDAIQPSHALSSPSPPAPNPSQHQSLFQWVNSSHEAAKVLEFQLQHQSFQWTPRTGLLILGISKKIGHMMRKQLVKTFSKGTACCYDVYFHFSLSHIGEGNGNPLQCCLENPGDRGAWWAAVYGVA